MVTPVKYECDIIQVLITVKSWKNNRTEKIGLVTPTHGPILYKGACFVQFICLEMYVYLSYIISLGFIISLTIPQIQFQEHFHDNFLYIFQKILGMQKLLDNSAKLFMILTWSLGYRHDFHKFRSVFRYCLSGSQIIDKNIYRYELYNVNITKNLTQWKFFPNIWGCCPLEI